MFNIDLTIDEIINITKKIINYILKSYNKLYSKKNKVLQIQILLEKRDSIYKLQIAYCGKIKINIVHLLKEAFNEVIKSKSVDEKILATVCCKNEIIGCNIEQIETVIYLQNKFVFTDKKFNDCTIRTYWDEYTCISLRNKIQLMESKKLEDCIKLYISHNKPYYPRIRFVFTKDGHQIIQDSLDLDISSCHAIASSMASIVENSCNDNFKKKCLDMWRINNPQEMNEKIFKQLIHHLENSLKA